MVVLRSGWDVNRWNPGQMFWLLGEYVLEEILIVPTGPCLVLVRVICDEKSGNVMI